jgi:hypothetical protein
VSKQLDVRIIVGRLFMSPTTHAFVMSVHESAKKLAVSKSALGTARRCADRGV